MKSLTGVKYSGENNQSKTKGNIEILFTIALWEILNGSVFGKRDLLAISHVMKYDAKCGTCLQNFIAAN